MCSKTFFNIRFGNSSLVALYLILCSSLLSSCNRQSAKSNKVASTKKEVKVRKVVKKDPQLDELLVPLIKENPDRTNEFQTEDLHNKIVKAFGKYKGKRIPYIEECAFELNSVGKAPHDSAYVAFDCTFSLSGYSDEYKDADYAPIDAGVGDYACVTLSVASTISRDVAKKLTKDKEYSLSGKFVGFIKEAGYESYGIGLNIGAIVVSDIQIKEIK